MSFYLDDTTLVIFLYNKHKQHSQTELNLAELCLVLQSLYCQLPPIIDKSVSYITQFRPISSSS